jgi:hypothetical protein
MGGTMCFRCRQSLDAHDELRSVTRTCGQCFGILLSGRDERLAHFLESLAVPAVLLAPDQTVLASNSRFQDMAHAHEITGVRVGEALGCMYTSTLGMCGETVACLLCRLKRSVEQTWATGEGLRGVPMSYPHSQDARRAFTVMTEKVGDAVLLMIGTRSVRASSGKMQS